MASTIVNRSKEVKILVSTHPPKGGGVIVPGGRLRLSGSTDVTVKSLDLQTFHLPDEQVSSIRIEEMSVSNPSAMEENEVE